MKDDKPKDRYTGSKFTVIHCDGALESFDNALSSVDARKRKAFIRGMVMQIQRLADGHRMTKENFPHEGNLPSRVGQQKAKKFNAFKRIPLRGYCWLSERYKNTYFISHYVYKDYGNLKERDTKRVGVNWSRIEEKGDER